VGKGPVGSFSQLNATAMAPACIVTNAGLSKVANFEASNAMNTMPAVEIVNLGLSNGLKITNFNDASIYALSVENSAGSSGSGMGGVAHFNQSAGMTAAAHTVLITSSATADAHKTLVVTPSSISKTAAEFNGKVDILGELTTTENVTLTEGDLEISGGDLEVGNDASIGGELTVTEGLTISGGGMTVTGVSTHTGNFNVVGTMTATTCVCPSDVRYKKNIKPVSNALDKVNRMDGVYYEWKQEAFPGHGFNDERQVGFIAQDLEQIVPELVHTDSEGYKTVNYAAITVVLVEAIKEQQEMIKSLQAELTAMQQR
jgi:hypothetical protein